MQVGLVFFDVIYDLRGLPVDADCLLKRIGRSGIRPELAIVIFFGPGYELHLCPALGNHFALDLSFRMALLQGS